MPFDLISLFCKEFREFSFGFELNCSVSDNGRKEGREGRKERLLETLNPSRATASARRRRRKGAGEMLSSIGPKRKPTLSRLPSMRDRVQGCLSDHPNELVSLFSKSVFFTFCLLCILVHMCMCIDRLVCLLSASIRKCIYVHICRNVYVCVWFVYGLFFSLL